MPKGRLIVIDGTDGSGKRTQTELLFRKLKRKRIKTAFLDIPVYNSFTGELVARYLRNDFGRIDGYLASTLYAMNRFEFKPKIDKWLKDGYVVVLNRYVTANLIHQSANLEKKDREKFKKWISKLEYEIFGLPKPDLVIFINMPVEIAVSMIKHKSVKERKYLAGAKKDLLESNLTHQKEAQKEIMNTAKNMKVARIINATLKGKLRSREEIAAEIWNNVWPILK